MRLVLGNPDVTDYLREHEALQVGGAQPVALVLLRNNTSSGRCAVGLHVVVDGKDCLVKMTLDMLQTLGEVARASALEQYGEDRLP